MKTETLIEIALIGGLAYFAYTWLKKNPVLNAGSNAIADFYSWVTLPPAMTVLGNIVLPSGDLIPLTIVDVRTQGNMTVANYQGHFYQLSPSDSEGNWPASLIQ